MRFNVEDLNIDIRHCEKKQMHQMTNSIETWITRNRPTVTNFIKQFEHTYHSREKPIDIQQILTDNSRMSVRLNEMMTRMRTSQYIGASRTIYRKETRSKGDVGKPLRLVDEDKPKLVLGPDPCITVSNNSGLAKYKQCFKLPSKLLPLSTKTKPVAKSEL